MLICVGCHSNPPPPQHDLPSSVCTPVEKYDNYKVTEFGSVAGAAKMKAEIYARGDLLLNSQLFHSILSDCYMLNFQLFQSILSDYNLRFIIFVFLLSFSFL